MFQGDRILDGICRIHREIPQATEKRKNTGETLCALEDLLIGHFGHHPVVSPCLHQILFALFDYLNYFAFATHVLAKNEGANLPLTAFSVNNFFIAPFTVVESRKRRQKNVGQKNRRDPCRRNS